MRWTTIFSALILITVSTVASIQCHSIHKRDSDDSKVFLTPYIKSGKIFQARAAGQVKNLPNAPDITSYAGYLTVNQTTNANLFFWFFPSENPKAPVAVWLQGGPGAASVFALFTENGPFIVHQNMSVTLRKYSWTNMFSMIYIDQPVGTGFSFTDSQEGYVTDMQGVADDLYEFMQQFYQMFPEQKANDLWITGESYGGRYVPSMAYKLHQERASSNINFKGVAIGDGYVDGVIQNNYADLLYQIGMFDERQRKMGAKYERLVEKLAKEEKWQECHDTLDVYLGGDRINATFFSNSTGSKNYFNFLKVTDNNDPFTDYLARDDVRQAINVGNHTMSDGEQVYNHLMQDFCKSVKPWLEELINAEYEVLLFNGQLDIIVAPVLTEKLIDAMQWSGKAVFKNTPKKIWRLDDEPNDVAGYVTSYQNFHFAVVRKAGHMVPGDQPKWAYDLIQKLVNGKLNYLP
ncbi:putative serine carboxypeptidase CPVL [Brevipalpus obovatus]|uniref:putative serine carboxypeptidase CPVL n=1 Tax=Brevipalpus obovatus TaxID=246614 RepID=UPI003D9F106F